MLDFRPPIDSPFMMAFCKWLLPLELWRSRVSVEIVGDGRERLERMRNARAVLAVNHSDQYDPEAIFVLSSMIGEDFHFIAARECFDWVFGSVGWWFQRLGCYSVLRGEADHESFATTREIIAHGKRHLVIFPEGEVTRQPDYLMPLRRGAMRLFFEGQELLLKESQDEPVFVVPLVVRWRYKKDIRALLHESLRRIEERLALSPAGSDLVDRTERASHAVLDIMEQGYFIEPNTHLSFAERVSALRAEILTRLSVMVNAEMREDELHIDWMRRVINAIELYRAQDLSDASDFRRRLHKEQGEKLSGLIGDCTRVQRLIAVGAAPEKPLDTQERLALRIAKLEREVLGKSQSKGHRVALIHVGEPINLLDYWSKFQRDPSVAAEDATEELVRQMQNMLDRSDAQIKSNGSLPIEIANK